MTLNLIPGTIFSIINDSSFYYYIGMNYNQSILFYLPINFSYKEKLYQLDINQLDMLIIHNTPIIQQNKNLSFYK
jgi:hypothetical protein